MHRDDLEGSHEPPPYFFKVTRMSYLWSHLDELQDFFDYYAISIVSHEHWLEIQGTPVPWDVPFGVILDSFAPYSLDKLVHRKHLETKYFFNFEKIIIRSEESFILEMVLHYRDYPMNLPPYKNIGNIKDRFIHCLKDSSISTDFLALIDMFIEYTKKKIILT